MGGRTLVEDLWERRVSEMLSRGASCSRTDLFGLIIDNPLAREDPSYEAVSNNAAAEQG